MSVFFTSSCYRTPAQVTAYSGDGVYMFSTLDEPKKKEDASSPLPSVLPSTVCFVLNF